MRYPEFFRVPETVTPTVLDHESTDNPVARYTEFFRESDHPLGELYRKRVEQDRDLVILITDSSNDRGTGKTTLTLRLAAGMDRTDEGLTSEKATLDPRPLTQAYTNKPPGSGLVMDETEVGMDKYNASSAVNRAIRELVSMGRIEQKYLCLNAPGDHLVDNDLKTLVDVWILIEERGFAKAYRMDYNPHGGNRLTHKMGTLEWDPIPKQDGLLDVYQMISEEKRRRLRGEDGGDEYILQSDADEEKQQAVEAAKQELRDEMIKKMYENLPIEKQSDIADVVDLSRSRITQITP